jgi:hypothetical protein
MPETPSPTMIKALALANRGGLVRFKGGFWSYPACPTRETRYMNTIDHVPEECVEIRTIDACVKRGWMVRRGPAYDAPADLTDAGRAHVMPSAVSRPSA